MIKVALASYVRADILKDLGRLDEALDGFDRAVTQADRVQATPEQALRWRAVALSVCAQIHGWDQVQPRLDDLAARLRTELLMETDEVRRSRLGAMILPLIEAQALEHALAEPGTAWQLLEQARSITFRAGMMEVRGANRITAHRRTLEEKLAESRALHARTRPTEEELRRRTEIGDEVLRAREALKAEIGRVAGDLAMVQPGDVPEGWLHLVYLVGEEISVVLAADRNGVQAVELQSRSLPIGLHPARSEDGSLTRDGWRLRLPDSVHRGLWNRDGDWLGSVLVPQEIRPRIAAAQRVILTVGNPLLDIVFDHLVDEEGRRLFRTGQVQPGESLTTVLESRRALGELRHSGDPIFFGVADHGDLPSDPETEPEPSDPAEPTDPEDRSAVSVRFSGAEKRNLPWVAEELRCIAGMYGVEPILNGAARAEGFAEALAEGRRLVGLSTHAAFDPGDPFRSVLAVHDPAEGRPFITLRRLLDLARGTGFRTRLLTLNCCMTALSGLGADGYVSIQYLLRRHGVQAVLATRWSVVDQAACVL
ncbi:MAG: CHAT domain-containing protein [Fimbriimonadaceae bacterium]|nr:CHAT domain-containing protein [Fimbriimonadaceae bacterium]